MFERVLEKILLNVIGPYVDGIDKSNLKVGIWSGKAEVYNISVKPEVLSMLDLPLQMIFSSIGKLSLSVPWKYLGSKPVEIVLEDVYIIVHPQDREKWEHADLQNASQKLKMMDSFAKSYSSKLSKKEEKEDAESNSKEQGLIAKLSEKAIDNVQISIKNIHFRFEDPRAKKPYAFGITLDEILLHTTNEEWEITFVDRTQPENKLLPMRKKLLLKNFGVYWTADESSEIFGNLVPAAMHKKMQQNILKNLSSEQSFQDYIININAECKLTQKNRKDAKTRDDPEFDITFYLAPIHLSVKKKQLQDMIYLTSFLEEYKKSKFQILKEKQKEAQDFMSESQLMIQKDEFQMLFKKILTKDQDGLRNMLKVRAALDGPEQAQLFEELLSSMPDEEIATAIKQSLKEIEKEKRLRELAEQKQEKGGKRAFFKNLFKSEKKEKQDDESLWEKEDVSQIEKYLDEALANDDDQEEIEEGKIKNLVKFKFISEAGSAILSNVLGNGSEQGITFQYTGLSCDVFVTSQSKKIDVDLNDFDLYLKTRYSSDKSFINTHVIRRVNYWLTPEKQAEIISLSYEDNPVGAYFKVKAQQVEVVYRKAFIDRLKEFTDLIQGGQQVYQDSSVNEEAFEIERRPAEKVGSLEEVKRRFFDIDFKAPVIVVPFLQNGDLKSECWVLNLGHFIMKTKDAATEEDQLYDKFEVVLNNLKFQYYPTHALFNKLQKFSLEETDISLSLNQEEEEEQKMLFDLVEKFNRLSVECINIDLFINFLEEKIKLSTKCFTTFHFSLFFIFLVTKFYLF